VAEQRAILAALAEHEGIDVDALVAEAHISEAESAATADTASAAEGSDDTAAGGDTAGTDEHAEDADDSTSAGATRE
jgi:hypothetical protein